MSTEPTYEETAVTRCHCGATPVPDPDGCMNWVHAPGCWVVEEMARWVANAAEFKDDMEAECES
jgi:hypothetical protein